jgi:hypothetical protein
MRPISAANRPRSITARRLRLCHSVARDSGEHSVLRPTRSPHRHQKARQLGADNCACGTEGSAYRSAEQDYHSEHQRQSDDRPEPEEIAELNPVLFPGIML